MKIKNSSYQPAVKLISTLFGLSLLTGCQTAYVGNPSWPTLSHQEADAFRQSLIDAHKKQPLSPKQETVYVQPLNKKEKCLVAFAPDLAKKKGLKSFWDGQCKNGYAFGLGRDIAIAKDGTHIEEISVYDDNHQNYGPNIRFDFKEKIIAKGSTNATKSSNAKSLLAFLQRQKENEDNVTAQHLIKKYIPCTINGKSYACTQITARYVDSEIFAGKQMIYPLSSDKTFVLIEDGVQYQATDWTNRPKSSVHQAELAIGLSSPDLQQPGGVVLVYYNGIGFRSFMASDKQPVNVPKSYVRAITDKMSKASPLANTVQNPAAQADQLLNMYLNDICNNRKVKIPTGISRSAYLKICSYEKQMDKKVAQTLPITQKIYEKEIKQAEKLLAIDIQKYREEQEHRARLAAYRAQIRAAESQEREAAYASLSRAFDSINKSSQQATNNAYSMMNSMSVPTPTPLTPNRSSEIYMVRPLSDHVTSVRQLY